MTVRDTCSQSVFRSERANYLGAGAERLLEEVGDDRMRLYGQQ
jgi:hypothetical protein